MTRETTRREKLRRLGEEVFDLLVVGGGINGAGIAREAALRGLRTALVEKGDFAGGTSSKSSKLIHGGLRYLQEGDLRLVLEASRERDLLRRRLAPHLVRPLPFFFPVYAGDAVGLWKLRAGLLAYDLLAGFRNIARHRAGGREWARANEPALRSESLRGAALYYDCFTDDARLVLETVLAAVSAGALCLNYLALESLEREGGLVAGGAVRDVDGEGGPIRIRARSIVNATGPWLDRVRALDDPSAQPLLRPTKGVHVVLPRDRLGNRNAVVLQAVRDRRVMFVIPWEDHAIVGTTDTDFAGDPDRVEADAGDVAYLLETANFYFPGARLAERDVVSTYAGLRPLIAGKEGESPSEISREEEIFESASGLVSVGGGKLTTYRRVAEKVVDRVANRLEAAHGLRVKTRSGTDREPLPGGAVGDFERFLREARSWSGLAGDGAVHLAARYGARCSEVAALIQASPELSERLAESAPDVRAEAAFAAASEMALRVEDVLRRRTPLALRRSDRGASASDAVARIMGSVFGWDEPTIRRRAEEYRAEAREAWRE